MKKILLYFDPLKGQKSVLERFINLRGTFVYNRTINYGNLKTNSGKEYLFVSKEKFNGVHLIPMFQRDLRERVEKGLYTPIYDESHEPKTVFFNTSVIKRLSKDDVVCKYIDLDDAYWNTAYYLKIIGEKTHKSGLQVKDWKQGRVAAIGALNCEHIHDYYENGKLVKTETIKSKYNFARVHIIQHIFDIALEIASNNPYAVAMFLTDCLFVHPDYEQYVVDSLAKYGYKCKIKNIWFRGVEKTKHNVDVVKWDDKETMDVKTNDYEKYSPHLHHYGKKNELSNILQENLKNKSYEK